MALTMPGEWTRHERCVMAWPARESMWRDQLEAAKDEYAATARAVATFEPVLMVAAPGAGAEGASRCGDDTAHGITVVEWPIGDSWTRDMGAIVVGDAHGRRAGVSFRFSGGGASVGRAARGPRAGASCRCTGWAEKFKPYDEGAQFAARMNEHRGLET